MQTRNCPIIAIVNQKGGVGKTTTTINLAQALALQNKKVLVVDLDPQANATQGMGVKLEEVESTIANLITNPPLSTDTALYGDEGVNLIPSSPLLARVEREMIGTTNSEFRVAKRLRTLRNDFDFIIIDTAPTFGPLMNSALNAATDLIIPVDSSYFALMGIKELLAEMELIQEATNNDLKVLGYLITMADRTKMTRETAEEMKECFSTEVFESKIHRSVKLKESPALGKTIFHHAPYGQGSLDYLSLSKEVISRTDFSEEGLRLVTSDLESSKGVANV